MKLFPKIQNKQIDGKASVGGYSIAEMMIASAIFTLIVICMVSSQLFALRTYSIAKAKMISSGGARKAEDQLRDQIRGASSVNIGNFKSFTNMSFSASAFPAVTNGLNQGNSLEIFPTTNSTPYYIYYLNPTTKKLNVYNSTLAHSLVLAGNIINTNIFASETFQGTVLSNSQNNSTIRMKLIFYQDVYAAQGGSFNDYYQITMRATIR